MTITNNAMEMAAVNIPNIVIWTQMFRVPKNNRKPTFNAPPPNSTNQMTEDTVLPLNSRRLRRAVDNSCNADNRSS
jgi:hypothetical protein